ncbi:heterokaryon incompatibility protein-domain-containing protein, partial [Leptodontidium sp. 2 PMI_412]
MIQPTGPPSKEEIDQRRAKQAEVNQANADLYQPNIALEKDRGNIRILIIEPSEDRNAPLICRLGRIFLHGGGYEALSYKWGLPFYRSEIMINGFAFSVTTELESALRHLRYPDPEHERWIWIDAICINQIDENEKRWQLELMRDVYHNAKRTLIWLGKGTQKSNKAIDFFNKRGRCHATIASLLKDYESNEPNKESWRCLQDILEREWWSRLWIVQEV